MRVICSPWRAFYAHLSFKSYYYAARCSRVVIFTLLVLAPAPNPLSFMVADFFISAHRRDMQGKLYVRRGGHLNLTLYKAFY